MKNLLYFLICIILSGCSSEINRKNIHYFNEFPAKASLSGSNCTHFKEDIYPLFMGIKDSLIVFCDIQNDPHIYVYNSADLKYLGSFGSEGKGPNDLNQPLFWGQFEDSDTLKAWFYEPNILRFSLLNFNEIFTNKILIPEKQFYLPPQIGAAVNILKLQNGRIVASGRINEGEFLIGNLHNEHIRIKPFLIDFDEAYHNRIKDIDLIQSYKQSIMKMKPDGKMFAKAHSYLPIIDVYNEAANLKFSIIRKDISKPVINFNKRQFEENTRVFYINIFLTDKYIYALNRNCTLIELNEERANNALIDVFTWDGKPVIRFELNEGISQMAPFIIDELNEKIFTVNPKDPFEYYSVFDISGHLNLNKN